ncbi:hypothetical protein VCHA28O22_110048 [Vibrio chagasii]|nr:hypothetical protein VCHA28O22_110048 [Vibrio chagasii]CAH6966949.1 hypothetical protein VCHA53O474_120072 [Vibrio chagasii]CAH7013394.1 hypothetical protein VCHA50O393_170048 [Vibrio chagasii]
MFGVFVFYPLHFYFPLVHGIFFKLSIVSNFICPWSVKVTHVHQEVAHDAIELIYAPNAPEKDLLCPLYFLTRHFFRNLSSHG